MVALRCLFEPELVRLELLLVRPRRAVDALQLRVLLGAAPVGRRHAHELRRVADPAGVRHVGTAAEVLPDDLAGLRVDVLVDGELAGADLDALAGVAVGRGALEADELLLVGLPRHALTGFVVGDHDAAEALGLADDPVHALLDRLEVLGRERLGDVEVVVVAVGDGRADAELGVRVDLLDRLCEHVRGRVPEDVEPSCSCSVTASAVSPSCTAASRSFRTPPTRMATTPRSPSKSSVPVVAVVAVRGSGAWAGLRARVRLRRSRSWCSSVGSGVGQD